MSTLTTLETLELESDGTHVVLAPERGGMVTRLAVGGRELLYLDEATLGDRMKNVRGGNPVLFPSPGRLANDRFVHAGRTREMKQHGFARQRAWRVPTKDAGSATLELVSDDTTRADFPWDFTLAFRHIAKPAALRIEQRIENRSRDAMSFALGFHPYFFVADAEKKGARIETSATRAFDNVLKKEIALVGPIDLTVKEVDLHLVDHGRSDATLHLPDGRRIVVSGSPDYQRWVVWTLAGKDFVCLEPWTAAANALNDRRGVTMLDAGAAHESWIEIALATP